MIVRASTFAVKVRVSKSVFPEMVTSPKVPSTINVESAVWPVVSKTGYVVAATVLVGKAPITWRYSNLFVSLTVNVPV